MNGNLAYPGFLESEIAQPCEEDARFHVIPAPYEKSVSYGTGTYAGPSKILAASQQLELFDGWGIPAQAGIYTHPPVDCAGSHEAALAGISRTAADVLDMGKFPVLLGGEHTVTIGALQALDNLSGEYGIIQFDAHADLRDTYQDSLYSHACVMRRALDMGFPILQIGVRSMSPEEHEFRKKERSIRYLDAADIAKNGIKSLVIPESFPHKVYITFDVDAFDPSVMPATGTPEPGGLNWYNAMHALEMICAARNVIGFDVVELAPISGLHYAEYTAARLIYNMMGFVARSVID